MRLLFLLLRTHSLSTTYLGDEEIWASRRPCSTVQADSLIRRADSLVQACRQCTSISSTLSALQHAPA
eukprot:6183842-Pleurochrysis_carterae.AAC.3